MKKLFKKTMTVLGSIALIGATAGFASAASYPAPFVDEGAVIVTGANAAASDLAAAGDILAPLSAAYAAANVGGGKAISGDDGVVHHFDKDSNHFNIGDTITGVWSSNLDDDELGEVLAEGEFSDSNNDDFEYTQEVAMASLRLEMFSDNGYEDRQPTVGFNITEDTHILNYTLDFAEEPDFNDLAESDLTIMGKDYYILSVNSANDTLTMLDSASEITQNDQEQKTVTVDGVSYDVTVDWIDSTKVYFTVDGEQTNSLEVGETQKLSSGAYIGVKEIFYDSRTVVNGDQAASKVVYSLGAGQIKIENGNKVEVNSENVDGVYGYISGTDELESLVLEWIADEDYFLTEDGDDLLFPAFETLKLSFTGVEFPAEEEIKVMAGADDHIAIKIPTEASDLTVPILYSNGSEFNEFGEGTNERLATSADGSFTFDADDDDFFVATYDNGDDAESYLVRVTNFDEDTNSNKNTTTFQYMRDGSWVDAADNVENGDDVGIGGNNVELLIGAINEDDNTVAIQNNTEDVNFYTLFSKEGLKVYLPHQDSGYRGFVNISRNASGTPTTSYELEFVEEDKDGDNGLGENFNVTLDLGASDTEPEVGGVTLGGTYADFVELQDDDNVYRAFIYSPLNTEFLWDKDADPDHVTIMYYGGESEAGVYLTAASVSSSGSTETGIKTEEDTMTSALAGKNLIVVGGSAINAVAAELLGGAYMGEEFTRMTGISAGEFMIKSFARDSKIALVVAGYNADDTAKAAEYLVNNEEMVDTAVGMEYKGTSATMDVTTVA